MSPVRSHVTRGIHLIVLLVVSNQLLTSVIMERPLPGDDPDWPFALHAWIGAAGLAVLMLFWLWTLLRDRSETRLSQLFPWFSPVRLRAVAGDAASLLHELGRSRRPKLEMDALASAIHGLGVALATFLAASGVAWYYFLDGSSAGRSLLALHKLAGDLMWAYLVGHAIMALAHQAIGDDVFSRMFWLRRRQSLPGE